MSAGLEAYDRAMERLAPLHEPFKVAPHLPVGEHGEWAVKRFTVGRDIQALRCWMDGRPVPPGEYTRLEHTGGTGLFMSDTPAEVNDARELLRDASGHVLITGLGIGMVPRALLTLATFDQPWRWNPEPVESITIVEKEADVIALVAPSLAGLPVEIIHADAFEWVPPKGSRFDWAWHDIWPDMSSDYIPEFTALRLRYRRFMTAPKRQLVWLEDHAKGERRRYG